jgi:hypothetical protein
MLKGTDVINFDSKITSTTLSQFVNTMLHPWRIKMGRF